MHPILFPENRHLGAQFRQYLKIAAQEPLYYIGHHLYKRPLNIIEAP